MIAKKRRQKLGKEIRKQTGLPFPVCMQAAKLIVRGDYMVMVWGVHVSEKVWRVPDAFIGIVKTSFFPCGPTCCGSNGYDLVGPKGKFHFG